MLTGICSALFSPCFSFQIAYGVRVFFRLGAEGGSNSSPPHVLASPAGSTGSSATSSVLSSLSTNPTLADKGKLPTATVGVGAPPSGKYSKTSGKKVPSSSDEKVKVPLPQNGVAGKLWPWTKEL